METVPKLVTGHAMGEEREKQAEILLAEDYPTNQQVALWHLRRAGYRVDLAENGQQAVEAHKRKHYDLILMDIEMPVMDGYEATARIRAHELELATNNSQPATRIPIIAMTAHDVKGDREKCMEAGMDDYVVKPIDPEALFSVLGKWIEPGKGQASLKVPLGHRGGEEVAEDLPPMLPGIHIEEGLRRLAGNRKLFKKLLKTFSTQFANAPEQIRSALESQQIEVARQLVHTLKGVAGNISAKDLEAAAQELEVAVREGVLEKCDMFLGNLEKAVSQVLESIRALGNGADGQVEDEPTSLKGGTKDLAQIGPMLVRLAGLLKENDIVAEEYMESIKKYLTDTGLREEIRRLEDQINKFDFKNAQKTLARIAEDLGVSVERERKG